MQTRHSTATESCSRPARPSAPHAFAHAIQTTAVFGQHRTQHGPTDRESLLPASAGAVHCAMGRASGVSDRRPAPRSFASPPALSRRRRVRLLRPCSRRPPPNRIVSSCIRAANLLMPNTCSSGDHWWASASSNRTFPDFTAQDRTPQQAEEPSIRAELLASWALDDHCAQAARWYARGEPQTAGSAG